jgi:hypothetical protein
MPALPRPHRQRRFQGLKAVGFAKRRKNPFTMPDSQGSHAAEWLDRSA